MYKYILIASVLVICLMGMGMTNAYNTAPWSYDALFSAQTTTGATSTVVSYDVPATIIRCTATWGGTAPTNVVFKIQGALDITSYETYTTITMIASPSFYTLADKPTLYLKSTYDSRSVGDATTALTLKCLGVGN